MHTYSLNLELTLTTSLTQQMDLLFMDSKGSSSDLYPAAMQKYLQDDLKDKGFPVTLGDCFINNQAIDMMLQTNGIDCGVFVCAFAYCLCNYLPLTTFRQKDMPFFRSHILCSIMKDELMDLLTYPNFPLSGTEGLIRK